MPDKPSYLGLLNAVALAESRAHCYLNAWIDVTPSADVRQVLSTVTAREGEHGMAFAKRINELGYEVRQKDEPRFAEQMAIAGSDCSDLEKMERLGLGRPDRASQPDLFDGWFANHSIDIRTGELLGRYIAEERDSERLLRSCHEQLRAAAGVGPGGGANGAEAGGSQRLGRVEDKLDALCHTVEELCEVVGAQTKKRRNL